MGLSRDRSDKDLEANPRHETNHVEREYETSVTVKCRWLGLYALSGLLSIFYHRRIVESLHGPWTFTGIHALVIFCVTTLLQEGGYLRLSRLSLWGHVAVGMYSMLFSASSAMSFLSVRVLPFTTRAFYQTICSTAPLVMVLAYRVRYSRKYSIATWLSLLALIMGTILVINKEYQTSGLGIFISLFNMGLGVVTMIATNRLLTGPLALAPLELIHRVSPYAAVQSVLLAVVNKEPRVLIDVLWPRAVDQSPHAVMATCGLLLGSGLIALLFHLSSFHANRATGALTLAVCGNIRQTLGLVAANFVFRGFPLGVSNATGTLLVAMGVALYTKTELLSRKASPST
ncbi:Drug/metabolite transporter [Penicillium alfredii]|uniref:Drug/metabolite transporter n=1 Tax=Penicillium alfredii TaxID=1506179 RepID=A0A9W9JX61_9EURO|nr:Drug/metabolite transporter [Penicillium alfredii]KAJ5084853.1 Drug/metabolite transporter [Penicillium alfredii]